MYDIRHSITHEAPVEQDCHLGKNCRDHMAHVHCFIVIIVDDDNGKHKQMHNSLDSRALPSMATHGV
jgi:hypothetical protein